MRRLILLGAFLSVGCGGPPPVCSAKVSGAISLSLAAYADQTGDSCLYYGNADVTAITMVGTDSTIYASISPNRAEAEVQTPNLNCQAQGSGFERRQLDGIVTATIDLDCGGPTTIRLYFPMP